ncbi:MAG: hypothetical protein PVH68_18465 [Armatimonadota bacterium]|jgi:hypothetical protein
MIAKGGTMLLAVSVVGALLLAGAAQPAEAKMSDTAKVVAAFAAGFVLADVLEKDHGRRHHTVGHRYGKPPDYRRPGPVVRIEHRPVWRPRHCGHSGGKRRTYRKGYRHGYHDGYRDGSRGGCRCGRHRTQYMGGCF